MIGEKASGRETANSVPEQPIGVLRAEWGSMPWLRHGFSTVAGGVSTVYGGRSLNLGWTKEDSADAVGENRRRLLSAVLGQGEADSPEAGLSTVRQVHSATVHVVRETELLRGGGPEHRAAVEADAQITDVPGVLLGVLTADCVPVLLADPKRRAVAAIHAGWRGTVQRIAERTIDRMREVYGSAPEDLIAAVGPSIGSCCYVVGEEVWSRFGTEFPYAAELFRNEPTPPDPARDAGLGEQQAFLDLWEANRRQLLGAGVPAGAVSVIGQCTACGRETDGARRFFSYRADAGVTGRMLSVIGIVADE